MGQLVYSPKQQVCTGHRNATTVSDDFSSGLGVWEPAHTGKYVASRKGDQRGCGATWGGERGYLHSEDTASHTLSDMHAQGVKR